MTSAAPHFHCEELLRAATVVVCDLQCDGGLPHQEPTSQEPAFLFPYRGMYVRHCGDDAVVAEAGQVLFQNPNEATRISHPIVGGDATLWLQIAPEMLQELVPNNLRARNSMNFSIPRLRIDPRTQVLVSLLRHSLKEQIAEPLEAESLSLTLVHRALGPATSLSVEATRSRRKLVDRTKLVLASDLSKRWSLAEIGAAMGASPVYLTQVFQQVERIPLYRYHLRLRLARALDLIATVDDLTAISQELGFSSHSHFSAAFLQLYGRTPSEFRDSAVRR